MCGRRAVLIGFLMVLWGISTPLQATVIFTSISGACCGGGDLFLGEYGAGERGAAAFTASVTSVLTDAEVRVNPTYPPIQPPGYNDPHFSLFLYSDAGGAPGNVIARLGAYLVAPDGGGVVTASDIQNPGPNGSFSPGSPVVLDAGTQYWLVLSVFGPDLPAQANTAINWEGDGTAQSSYTSDTIYSAGPVITPWTTPASSSLQFQIDGDPAVPEPMTVGLAAASLALIAMLRRRS